MEIHLAEYQKKIKLLHETYFSKLPEKLEILDQCLEKISQHLSSNQDWALFYNTTHKLAGSATTFGLPKVSQIANRLQILISDFSEHKELLDENKINILSGLVDDLKSQTLYSKSGSIELMLEHQISPGKRHLEPQKKILIVEDDSIYAEHLALQLEAAGFLCTVLTALEPLEEVLVKTRPDLILMDMSFHGKRFAGAEVLKQIRLSQEFSCPLIFHSSDSSFESRLEAVRAGANCFLCKTTPLWGVIDVIDQMLYKEQIKSFWKVLVVPEDELLVRKCNILFEQEAIKIFQVPDPTCVMDKISEHSPDLILINLCLPKMQGEELAAVIRQVPSFERIPIVFLSSEKDSPKRIEFLRQAGEDILQKNIDSTELLLVLKRRLQRFARLGQLFSTDALTGLLNFKVFLERAEQEIIRARRHNIKLTLAKIDIDHLSLINEAHGHAVGDEVITELAYLLEKKLRRSDIVGRVGGDEFCVLLPETEAEKLLKIFEEIAQGFQSILFRMNRTEFTASFSCGLSSLLPHHNVEALMELADQGLKKAKKLGQSKVVIQEEL
ncbi:MAG: diguanylate cyclase [Deltaproteobacteria bacterium]|nr:diguanylate cyclase [Deltaproteobacteria bacterium]